MQMMSPNLPQDLMDRLNASGLAKDVKDAVIAELKGNLAAAQEHICVFCGRSSDTFLLPALTASDHPFPSQWVYCYRGGKSYGLCDLCFRVGHYWGLSELEVAYFKDTFDAPADPMQPRLLLLPPA